MEKRIPIIEMPLVVAQLADYGITCKVTNVYSFGNITDDVIISTTWDEAACINAMKRIPKWWVRSKIHEIYPKADYQTDNDGQLVIYTGYYE